MAACASFRASGQRVKATTDQAVDPVAVVVEGRCTVRGTAAAVESWLR
ncbi:hypothetical protein [Streptomyces sp. DH37]|nr:hypothetical protein [Streptomyces sp. DH37]MDG9703289.1 hypothetical protein [Streptomyces sp. DH37]